MGEMKTQADIRDTDRALVEAILDHGEERAFLELYDCHTPRLLGFVHRLLGRTDAEAEDVVQETWIRVCSGLKRFRWDSAFPTWLLGIGLNVVRDHLRRKARSKMVGLADVPDNPAPPRLNDERIDLERAIQRLPDGYRMALVLHDVEGMKHTEIAWALGISAGTSKSQLFHARRLLRDMLSYSTEVDHE